MARLTVARICCSASTMRALSAARISSYSRRRAISREAYDTWHHDGSACNSRRKATAALNWYAHNSPQFLTTPSPHNARRHGSERTSRCTQGATRLLLLLLPLLHLPLRTCSPSLVLGGGMRPAFSGAGCGGADPALAPARTSSLKPSVTSCGAHGVSHCVRGCHRHSRLEHWPR